MKNKTCLFLIALMTFWLTGIELSFGADNVPITPINLNTASIEELAGLPGIGQKKAAAIVAYRQTKSFASVEELEAVKGIGPALLEKIKPQVTVGAPAVSR